MRTLTVALGSRSYPIVVSCGSLARADLVRAVIPQLRVAVVTNQTIAPLYLQPFTDALEAVGIQVVPVILPDGEVYKTWKTLNLIFDSLIENHCERRTAIIGLGGGVVGDMAGFAAATWQRGAPFIQAPTTLLAQVDSSVGGKTAINHPRGKNMIGAFYQPRLVLSDLNTLSTLPERELKAGLAEVIKHGLIRDVNFFCWLEEHIDQLLARDPQALEYAVVRCCEIKAEVVTMDEREEDVRAWLNFGHTFGHAIEAGLGFGQWLHGEAVAAGMMMAAELSLREGLLQKSDVERIERLLSLSGLPSAGPKWPYERYFDLMSHDKKSRNGDIRFVLLDGLGKAVVKGGICPDMVRSALNARTT